MKALIYHFINSNIKGFYVSHSELKISVFTGSLNSFN